MTRIQAAFSNGQCPLLIPCTVAGDPDPYLSLEIMRSMIRSGADAIELIIPSTNPVADGPAIRRAHERAIAALSGVKTAFSLIREIRKESEIPITLMTYATPVVAVGEDRFLTMAADAGADGILVVDMPPEEGASLIADIRLDPIFIIAPSTPPHRIRMIGESGRGFLYLVSAPGVTGKRKHLPADLAERIRVVKAESNLSVAVGFGIGSPDTAYQAVAAGADAVIVGSVISEAIESDLQNPAPRVGETVALIRSGMSGLKSNRSSGQ
ncbi:MAG: tryptophan synthase subunit alpha [Methanocalculus sp. MSAO_Arc2]|uniref:tryptophan synthase subunit alpha n=1 Tax=Methanocalculus sp. MSAO_Arc2 TaxID=2293855 RepID=UPI000FF5FE87|nr:MAG: tryptophan synthase subunit alpha [Methanocalculus sp. MSAO_Arc2]